MTDSAIAEAGAAAVTGAAEGQEQDATLSNGASQEVTSEAGLGDKPVTAGNKSEGDDSEGGSQGAPETYGEFTLPEGMEMNSTLLESFNPIAKELNLTQDQAQKLIDIYAQGVGEITESQIASHNERLKSWSEQTRNDPEIGGDKYDENLALANRAYDGLATPELRDLADSWGLSKHPEFIRLFVKIGKMTSEDNLVPSGGVSTGRSEKTHAQKLYGNK